MHDQTLASRHHHQRRPLARYERAADADRHHCLPTPKRLLPERGRPGELAIFDHTFVTAPGAIDEYVKALALGRDSLKELSDASLVGRIAGHRHDARSERGRRHGTSGGV